MTDKIAKVGGNEDYWVSRVVSSPHDAATTYVCKSGFRNDDFTPLIFKTTDYGQSWNKITDGISKAPVNVIIEDPHKPGLLYAGNDKGVFISFDGGIRWQSFKNNMPVVAVKDLKIQERENDLIVGTYGRGAYIIDVSLLQQINKEVLNKDAFLFDIASKPLRNYSERAYWGNYELSGDSHAFTDNEQNGLVIYYYLRSDDPEASIEILNGMGDPVKELKIAGTAGFHKIVWYGREFKVGKYLVKFKTSKQEFTNEAEVVPAPSWPIGHTSK
jgi:hypothetical protein